MSGQEPYVGPRSFEPNESRIFFGRTEEVDRLVSLVLSNRTVVLCGQSGAGKTSLINAGLLPALQAEGIRVVRRLRVIGPEPHAMPPSDAAERSGDAVRGGRRHPGGGCPGD